ncbi:hypothetical protein [Falsiroseomonas sp. E2-1-a20]|uniref:hypothetical protein n=1 Tax=Falsiroseomonas sp. E2-1-a20 TaxID=3239300 RepID=UPI003F2D4E9A
MSRTTKANITEAQWDAIQAAWETGRPGRALAAEYAVDESTIRYRASTRNWQRDRTARERIRSAAQARTWSGRPIPASRPPFPRPGLAREAGCGNEMRDGLAPAYRERLREAQIDAAADAIAEANLRALAKADQLSRLFERLDELLTDVLTTPAEDDEAGWKRRASARDILLAGRKDSVIGAVLALAKLAGAIQVQTRKALGADEPAMQVPLAAPDSGPTQNANHSTSPKVDFSKFTTDELETMQRVAEIIGPQMGWPAVPTPPAGPKAAAPSNLATEANGLDCAAALNPQASDARGSPRSSAQARHILGKADGSWASPTPVSNSNRLSNETIGLGGAETATGAGTPRPPPTRRAP